MKEINAESGLRLCYSFLPHGDATRTSSSRPRPALLPQLRPRGHGPVDLRGLLSGDLPALRDAT